MSEGSGTDKKQHLVYLVDGSGYIFRAYHALPPLTRTDGTPVNAVLGFCNMLYKLLDDLTSAGKASHLAVIFDTPQRHLSRVQGQPSARSGRPDPAVPAVPGSGGGLWCAVAGNGRLRGR